jgi:DHA2 family multidrug resistance protein
MAEEDSLVEYGARRAIITITAILCTLLEIVDSTVVNVALNHMRGNLGATVTEIAWVITAYAIGNVIIIPMTSWLAIQFGRRNYFAASIILFTICSFLCGNATSIWELVTFRLMQGIGGGALLATSQTIITETYPREQRSVAQAIYGLGVIVGPTLGPPLGGYIVYHYSWPYIFYINIPLGIAATLLTLQYVRSPNYGQKKSGGDVDYLGILLLAGAIGCLQFVLERGQDDDWFADAAITICTVASFFCFFFFIWREMTFRDPIVNLRVLKNGNLRIGTLLTFILGFGLYGSTFVIPLYTQGTLGWTPEESGMLMIPSALATAAMMPLIGQILQRGVKQQYLVSGGMLLFFLFCLFSYTILTNDTGEGAFFWILIVRGIGMGMLFVPITTLSLSTLTGVEIAQGVALTGMMRQLGGSFGVALISTFMARRDQLHRMELVSKLNVDDPMVQQRVLGLQHQLIAHGVPPNIALQKAWSSLDGLVTAQAGILSYMDVFLYLGVLFLVCIPFILMVRENKGQAGPPAAAGMH